MSNINVLLTKADFNQFDWEKVIRELPIQKCSNFYRPLFHKSKHYQEINELKNARILLIFGSLTSLYLSTNLAEPVFSNSVEIDSFLGELTDEEITILTAIAPTIQHAEMRARVADYLWVEQRDFSMVSVALQAYLDSANNLITTELWNDAIVRLERATSIWTRVGGSRNKETPRVTAFIEKLLQQLDAEDKEFFSARLLQLLLDTEQGNPEQYIAIATKGATNNPGNKCACQKPLRSRMFLQAKANWQKFIDQFEEVELTNIQIAETYVNQASGQLKCYPNSYSQAVWYLESAVKVMRKIRGQQKRTDEILSNLREYQRLSKEHEFSDPNTKSFDLTQLAIAADNTVGGKPQHDAIISLGINIQPQNIKFLKKMILDMAERNPFQFHIPMVMIDNDARVVGVSDSLVLGSEEQKEIALDTQIFRKATFYQDAVAKGFIRPALQRLLIEHRIEMKTISDLMKNNPFVPEGREYIFTRGIYAGFKGDFLTAVSLLIPQLEHAIRTILEANGVRVISFEENRIQNFHTLDPLLKHPKLLLILGEDTVYDLRGLLTERFGSNLRNELAHGLMDDFSFFSDRCVYLWGLVLRLCCIPTFLDENKSSVNQQTE